MSTAIFIMYTAEGFAFGADGRQCKDDRSVFNDEAQKVFSIVEPKRCLGYALAGTVVIPDRTNNWVIFNFNSEAPAAVQFLATKKPIDLEKYSREFAFWINDRLRNSMAVAKANGMAVHYPDNSGFTYDGEAGNTIARLFLAGYYDAVPGWTLARFFHVDQRLEPPTIQKHPIFPGHSIGYGSRVIAGLLDRTDDPRFSAYRRVSRRRYEDTTLSEAIEFTNQHITAQMDPLAKEIDPDVCSWIGGRVHIAKLTMIGGFQWVIPPLQFTNRALPMPNFVS
jgi:hypothetical protein